MSTRPAPNTAVATVQPSLPTIATLDPARIRRAIEVNLGGAKPSPTDFTQVRVSTGVAGDWLISSFDGEKREKSITGIITVIKDVRRYWKQAFGTGEPNQPPDCVSNDMIHGIGDPGVYCAQCPNNAFGTKGKGKACRESKMLFIHRQTSILPDVISLPPTSLGACKGYLLNLASRERPYFSVVTEIRLVPEKNAGGIQYSEARFSLIEELSEEQTEKMFEVHLMFKELVENVRVQDTQD